jgi:hypothetical protein
MLLNVAAHYVSIPNVKVSKRERHITHNVQRQKKYSVINVKSTLCSVHFSFWTEYVLFTLCDVYVLKTLPFGTLTLCAATFCNITSCDIYIMLLYVM